MWDFKCPHCHPGHSTAPAVGLSQVDLLELVYSTQLVLRHPSDLLGQLDRKVAARGFALPLALCVCECVTVCVCFTQ